MSQEYSDPSRESDEHALPDIEVFELTAREAAELDEDMVVEYSRCREYRLASMNSKVREAMFDAIVEHEGITGGWYWHACLPGCLPDGEPTGPFATKAEALADAQNTGE